MSAPTPRPGRFVRSPVVLRDGQWWLVSGASSILASDPTFTSTLDRFAALMAAADQSVAVLRTEQGNPPASRCQGRR